MAFEKAFENTYQDLTQETKYRFAEIEIARTVYQLTDFYKRELNPRQQAINAVYNAIVPKQIDFEETAEMFTRCMLASSTNNPPKNEVIHYLIAQAQSYKRIRELTSASYNTIAGLRYHIPQYYPNFGRWNEEMLLNWNKIKPIFNLWHQELVHSVN